MSIFGSFTFFKRPQPGRPRDIEKENTVLSGTQLISWTLPRSDHYEMMSADDLLTKRGYRVYREMRADDQIKAALHFKKLLIISRPWDIQPSDEMQKLISEQKKFEREQKKAEKEAKQKEQVNNQLPIQLADPPTDKPEKPDITPENQAKLEQALEIVEFVEKILKEIPFRRILWEMLTAFDYGCSYGEIIWEVRKIGEELRVVPKDVAFRDPEFMHIHCDEHGNITEFRQTPTHFPAKEIFIQPDKMLHYAYQSEFRNHLGISDLRAAYRAWWSKKYVTQFFNIFLERFGAPLMMMKYPPGSSNDLKTALRQILEGLSSKTDILVPEGVKVELIEATRAGTAKFDDALKLYDISIANAILMPALLGMGTDIKRGSDSQSRMHVRTLTKMVDFICEELARIFQEKIIWPMIQMNFDTDEKPRLVFSDQFEFENFEVTDAIKELHAAGILELDGLDTNYIRSMLNMPVRPEGQEDEVQRQETLPPMAPGGDDQASGGGAGKQNKRAAKGNSTRKTDPGSGRQRPNRR